MLPIHSSILSIPHHGEIVLKANWSLLGGPTFIRLQITDRVTFLVVGGFFLFEVTYTGKVVIGIRQYREMIMALTSRPFEMNMDSLTLHNLGSTVLLHSFSVYVPGCCWFLTTATRPCLCLFIGFRVSLREMLIGSFTSRLARRGDCKGTIWAGRALQPRR